MAIFSTGCSFLWQTPSRCTSDSLVRLSILRVTTSPKRDFTWPHEPSHFLQSVRANGPRGRPHWQAVCRAHQSLGNLGIQTRDSQHSFFFSTELILRPSRLRRPHSTLSHIASSNSGPVGRSLDARVLARLCPAPDATTSSLGQFRGSSSTPSTAHDPVPHQISSKPTVRERRPRHWFSLGMKSLHLTSRFIYKIFIFS